MQTTLFKPHYEAFLDFHAENPIVYTLLVQYARQAKSAGVKKLGIALLFERLRWYSMVETTGDEYKLNNNHRAYYARLIMKNNPDLAGMFEIRGDG
jgi:hypothetical protein